MHCAQCGINITVEDHYCFACGARKLVNCDLRDKNDFIEYYFKKTFQVWVDISSTRYSSQNQNEFTPFEEASESPWVKQKSSYCFSSCYKVDHREGNRRPVHATWLSEYVEQIENN